MIDNGNDKAGQGSNGISGVKATDLSPSGAYTYGLNASSLYNTAVYGTSGYGITAQFYNGASGASTCTYSGGPGWSCTSDRNLKQDFTRVDSAELLERLDAMPIFEYSMKGAQDAARYLGPTAQDFAAAFHLGEGDKTINTANAQGVALAAAKGLYERVKADEGKIAEQAEIIAALTRRLAALEQKFETEASLRRAGAEPALAIKTALEQPPL